MAIRFRCMHPPCRKMLEVKDDFAGKRIKCPGCGNVMQAPSPGGPAHAPKTSPQPANSSSPDSPKKRDPVAFPQAKLGTSPVPVNSKARWFWAAGAALVVVLLGVSVAVFFNPFRTSEETPDDSKPPVIVAKGPQPKSDPGAEVIAKDKMPPEPKGKDKLPPEPKEKAKPEAKPAPEKFQDDPAGIPPPSNASFQKLTGVFQKANLDRGQKSTVLRVEKAEYLLKLVPSGFSPKENPEIKKAIKTQLLVAKVNAHNRVMKTVSTGDRDVLNIALNELSQVTGLYNDDQAIAALVSNIEVVGTLGLKSDGKYVVEGIVVRDSSLNDSKWLVATSIDGRPICTQEEALAWRDENLEYFKWAGFPPETKVTHLTLRNDNGKTEKSLKSATVLAVDADNVRMRNTASNFQTGKEKEYHRQEQQIPRYIMGAPKTVPENAPKTVPAKLDSGTELFTTVEVNWTKSRVVGKDSEYSFTIWTSKAFPGHFVKRTLSERSQGKDGKSRQVEEVEELKEVSGPSTAALAKAWQQHRLATAQPVLDEFEKAITAKDKLRALSVLQDLHELLGDVEALRPLRQREQALPAPAQISFDLGDGEKLILLWIPPGHFQMGSASGKENEQPAHKVTFTKGFYLGQTEVTEAQWKVLDGHYSRGWTDNRKIISPKHPADGVTSGSMAKWLTKVGAKIGRPGHFRLPTEAEWEYACRAGSTAEYSFGANDANLGDYAWFQGNSKNDTHPVAQKKANAWGLYDMHGNALEWCSDPYQGKYAAKERVDPTPPSKIFEGLLVVRGGSWRDLAPSCRSAHRSAVHSGGYVNDPKVGLRVVFEP